MSLLVQGPQSASIQGADEHTAPSRRGLRALAVALLIFFVFFVSPNSDGGDGYLIVPTAYSMVHDQDLDLSEFHKARWYSSHYAVSEVNGRTVNYFPWLTAVFAVPAVVSFDALHSLGLARDQQVAITDGSVASGRVTAAIVATLAALVLALVARRLLLMMEHSQPQYAHRASSWLRSDGEWTFEVFALVMALGTSLWSTASRSMWQHGPSMLVGGLGILGVLHLLDHTANCSDELSTRANRISQISRAKWPLRRNPAAVAAGTGTLLALSYWIRPTNVILTLVAIGVLGLCRRKALVPMLGGMLGAHLAILTLNILLLGVAMPPYFKASRFEIHDQYFQAVAGNLISPARGLFVFSPFLLGAVLIAMPSRWRLLDRKLRTYAVIALGGSAGYLVVVSGFAEQWWAGISYGPRFMSESVVLLGPLALVGIFGPRVMKSRPDRTRPRPPLLGCGIAVVAICLSVVAHGGGSLLTGVMCWGDRGRDNYPARVWDWSDPQFLEGPDLLLRDGLSFAMNSDCPRY